MFTFFKWFLFAILAALIWTVVFVNKTDSAEMRTLTLSNVLCEDNQILRRTLKQYHNEVLLLSAVVYTQDRLMHIYVNKETGTWSMVILTTDGVYCMLLHGDGFTPVLSLGTRS